MVLFVLFASYLTFIHTGFPSPYSYMHHYKPSEGGSSQILTDVTEDLQQPNYSSQSP